MKSGQLKRIEWMNKDSEMLVYLEESQGFLSYESSFIMSASHLNSLLNQFLKRNPEVDLDSVTKIEQWSENEFNYIFQFQSIEFEAVLIEETDFSRNYRQIRA